MRFHAQAPDIPLDLLEARDRGEVVFFCGAGVSMPAGLPSFRELARKVVADLGVPIGDPAEELLARALAETNPVFAPPMDQVFGILQADYGVAQVEEAVARRLRAPRKVDTSRHQTVLELSADPAGRRRVVTTNFDPLFERADRRLRRFTAPNLPDLGVSEALEGVVYLHGRAESTSRRQGANGLVLGSSDFGRAYLSEGWATRFIRQLLSRYTLVLLGYSADDPPVRYLLEGLHAAGSSAPASIFAFGEGGEDEVQTRWRARGVRAIAYPRVDSYHSALWDTLESWAIRADDPARWRGSVAALARHGGTCLVVA